MLQELAPSKGRLWIYGVLPPVILNVGAVLLFGSYYALRATNPSMVLGLTPDRVQFFSYLLVFAVEWGFALLLIRQRASEGIGLRCLIAPRGSLWSFRKLPAIGVFLFFNGSFVVYVWAMRALYGAWPRLSSLLGWERAFMLIAVPLTAAFCEELIWRGHLIPELEARKRTRSAVIILAAVSFACIHGIFLLDKLALTFVIGIVTGIYYIKERNLMPLILSHLVVDLWSFALSVL